MQEYKVSNYHSYIAHLIDDGKFFSFDSDKLDDHAFSSLLHSKGVKSILNVPIKTLNGNIIGILGVDYVKGNIDLVKMREKFGEEDCELYLLKFIKAQARAIGGYLI
ncbi:GAF domain-containing protein [Candidatus Woesearchaeota archaeon]|nr:GAF domain-containing protein [Candidatus Woesearchaeota archaeon]